MKKYIFLIITLLGTTLSNQAQNNNYVFAGKTFKIDNYIDDKFDNSEDLTFTDTYVEGSICIQYGFEKAKYTTSTNEKGFKEFTCTMISKEHGKMVWIGEKKGEYISGKYIWTKEGQNDIHYTFRGKIK